jgi:hypothetical protein
MRYEITRDLLDRRSFKARLTRSPVADSVGVVAIGISANTAQTKLKKIPVGVPIPKLIVGRSPRTSSKIPARSLISIIQLSFFLGRPLREILLGDLCFSVGGNAVPPLPRSPSTANAIEASIFSLWSFFSLARSARSISIKFVLARNQDRIVLAVSKGWPLGILGMAHLRWCSPQEWMRGRSVRTDFSVAA